MLSWFDLVQTSCINLFITYMYLENQWVILIHCISNFPKTTYVRLLIVIFVCCLFYICWGDANVDIHLCCVMCTDKILFISSFACFVFIKTNMTSIGQWKYKDIFQLLWTLTVKLPMLRLLESIKALLWKLW